jgi:hypothetical protein
MPRNIRFRASEMLVNTALTGNIDIKMFRCKELKTALLLRVVGVLKNSLKTQSRWALLSPLSLQ